MDDFFINGETQKIKIVRAQAHNESVKAMQGVHNSMMGSIAYKMNVAVGNTAIGNNTIGSMPEPHSLTPEQSKEVLLGVIELIMSTGNALNISARTSEKMYFGMVEKFHPELANHSYRVSFSFGEEIGESVTVKVSDIDAQKVNLH